MNTVRTIISVQEILKELKWSKRHRAHNKKVSPELNLNTRWNRSYDVQRAHNNLGSSDPLVDNNGMEKERCSQLLGLII
jgi:hypothetical protein